MTTSTRTVPVAGGTVQHPNDTFPYHRQDYCPSCGFCGPACAQMVLHDASVGIPLDDLEQSTLYNDYSDTTGDTYPDYPDHIDWNGGTAPDELCDMLNGTIEQVGLAGPKFDTVAIPDRDAMSHFLVWNLCHTRVMPLVLVRDTAHWVALSSCDVSAIPAKANDPFDIMAVYIHDPSPISTLGIEHSDNDDCGGGHQQGYRDRHLTYQQWLNTYLTPVPKGTWAGSCVAICATDAPAAAEALRAAPPGARRAARSGDRAGQAGSSPVQPDAADLTARVKAAALQGLKDYGLTGRKAPEPWSRVKDSAEPGEPVRVEMLDPFKGFYFVVPIANPGKEASVAVIVDGEMPAYLESTAVRSGPVLRDVTPGQTHYWKPSRESYSPFHPFTMTTVRGRSWYHRIDGEAPVDSLRDDLSGA